MKSSLYATWPVLNCGSIRLIEKWGSDRRIIEAARMSTGKGFLRWTKGPCPWCTAIPVKGVFREDTVDENGVCIACAGKGIVPGDMKLLEFLYRNWHHTPFEMAGMILELELPIFVVREWHRHRTQSYNEMSARYIQMPNRHYLPTLDRIKVADKKNKQSSGSEPLDPKIAEKFILEIRQHQQMLYDAYDRAIKAGVPKEIARLNTPVSRMTKMRASANLRNWLSFLTLRHDTAAQWEIREYAAAVHSILQGLYPRTMKLFDDGRRERLEFLLWRSDNLKRSA